MALRILFLVRGLATGTQTYTENIIRELTADGVEVMIGYTGGKPQEMPREPIRLDQGIPRSIDSSNLAQPLRFLPVLMRIQECVVAFKPHVILAQGLDENGFTASVASLLFRRPAISFVHDLTLEELLLKNPKFSSLLYAVSLLRQRITIKRLSGVLVASNFMRDSISRMFGVSATVTRLGVRQELLGQRAMPSDFPFQMIFIGNLSAKKRPEIPVRIVAALKDLNLRLAVVGDGPEKQSLLRLCESLRVADKVDFKGRLSAQDLAREIRSSHVCIVPSIWEGFGLAALEAMSCGVPVIASDSGGLSELVKDGKNGVLVQAGDDKMWSANVRKLYDDRALLGDLSERCFEDAKSYDWASTEKQTLEAIRIRTSPEV